MKYFTDQNTSGYTPEQLEKMNQEMEQAMKENNLDVDFDDTFIKHETSKILAEMDKKIEKKNNQKRQRKIWWTVNKCDEQGNIITGYEEELWGTKDEVEVDFRHHHEYEGHVDIEPMLAMTE